MVNVMCCQVVFDPLIGQFFAAGRTEPTFAAEANLLFVATAGGGTQKTGKPEYGQSTAEHFHHVINDGGADMVFMFFKKLRPSIVFEKQ